MVTQQDSWVVLVACCAKENGGVWAYRLDEATGALAPIGRAPEMASALFLTLDSTGRHVYAVGDQPGGATGASGVACAFAFDRAKGRLESLGHRPTLGADACHAVVAPGGRALLVANYRASLSDGAGRGSVSVLPIASDGRLGEATQHLEHAGAGPNPHRQTASHPHSVTLTPDGTHAIVADLGTDELVIYPIAPGGAGLVESGAMRVAVAAGQGPRHLAFAPPAPHGTTRAVGGRFGYLVTEMGSRLVAYRWEAGDTPAGGPRDNKDPGDQKDQEDGGDPRGQKGNGAELVEIGSVALLPEGFAGRNDAADLHVHPSGRWVYASNRGHDSIAVVAVDPATGRIGGMVQHVPCDGRTPRGFALDPAGRFAVVANQGTDNLAVFRVDEATGQLHPTGHMALAAAPVCVAIV
jgi:6-phosphogluconolactonase